MRLMDGALAGAAVIFAGVIAAWSGSADTFANPSYAEVAIGGLTLLKTDAISMDSEDLYISRDVVRVKYRFTNTTDKPVDALVAFPLPDVPPQRYTDEHIMFWSDPSELKFKTRVDGQLLALQVVEQAFFKGEDVSGRLSALHVPLNPRGEDTDAAIKSLPESDRGRLAADGFIQDLGRWREVYWGGLWTLRTTVSRHQTFPPRQTSTVEHEYKPRVGGNTDEAAVLDPRLRNPTGLSELHRKYCIDDPWIHSFDKRLENQGDDTQDSTLGYVLTTGVNWKGPIGDFRLVVDKVKPESLVSFCADGVKQISPTQYEVRHANFTPKEDLEILFIDWY